MNEKLVQRQDRAAFDATFGEMVDRIFAVLQDKAHWWTSSLRENDREALWRLSRWPGDCVWPVLDLFRALMLHSNTSSYFLSEMRKRGGFDIVSLMLACSKLPVGNAVMLAWRVLANAFVHEGMRAVMLEREYEILNGVVECSRLEQAQANSNARQSYAAVLIK